MISSAEFRRQAHFRLQPGGRPNLGFSDFERRISASGTVSASSTFSAGTREPNLGFSAEFRRQDHFRLHSFAGSNIGAEFERQPNFGFNQHRPNLGAEYKLQNLSFRGGPKPGPTSPGPCTYVNGHGCPRNLGSGIKGFAIECRSCDHDKNDGGQLLLMMLRAWYENNSGNSFKKGVAECN